MKIIRDDPCDKMTIRLKLAAMAMQAYIASGDMSPDVTEASFMYADRMIARATREETDDKADRDEGKG